LLDGKVALITGSGQGTGRALALKLAGDGVRIVVNDIDAEAAAECRAEICARGGEAIAIVRDIMDADAGGALIMGAIASFGQIDIIVNNASFVTAAPIDAMTDAQFAQMTDVNMAAPFRILRAAARHFRDRFEADAAAGRETFRKVVNVTSTLALEGGPTVCGYAAGKAGLIGLTKALAKEWGAWKVNVNAVALGLVATRLGRPYTGTAPTVDIGGRTAIVGIPADRIEVYTSRIPLGRGATPEEAAGAIYLLCTPESDFITGHVLVASGGMV
jgi:3-oxoacyl-[acyl-carrier protein] reductase